MFNFINKQWFNLFCYCINNPINFVDSNGYVPYAINYQLSQNIFKEKIKDTPISNSIIKVYIKKSFEILSDVNLKKVFGNLSFSIKKYILNQDAGFFYQSSEKGSDGFSQSVGINALGIFGIEVGFNDNYNLFYNVNITPWAHFGASIGLDGIGFNGGIFINNTSYDFDVHIGWGTVAVVAVAIVAPVVSPFVAFFNWLFGL